jgi:hypothetical protein
MNTTQSFLNSKWTSLDFWFNQETGFFHTVYSFFVANGPQIVSIYRLILILLALFFCTMIAYCLVRIFEIRKKEKTHLHHEIEEYAQQQKEKEEKSHATDAVSTNPRWIQVLAYLFSQHASDWKLAIIEADSMLDSLLDQLGFRGETLADKLKSADQDKMKSLSSAWEVHTIRNRIAHEGVAFEVSQREAKRVIALYEQIFREYGYI